LRSSQVQKNWSTTLVLDLRRSEDEIFASFSTLARRAIRAVAKGPLEVRPVDDAGFAHRLDALSGETLPAPARSTKHGGIGPA